MRPSGFRPVVAAAILLAAALACAHRPPATLEAPERIVVWPPPPAPSRIEYVQAFHVPEDLGIRKIWLVRFLTYLARGRRPTEMVRPMAVAVAPDGRIAVADPDARGVHIYDPGRSRYQRWAVADRQPLVSPVGVAADAEGRFYVSDSFRGAIFRYGADGDWIDTIGGGGALLRPTGLAFDRRAGLLYVADTLGHRIAVFDTGGRLVRQFGRRGRGEGEFNYPVAIAVGPEGRLYVADSLNFRVQILDPEGRTLGSFGEAGVGPGRFDKAKGIAVDSDGHIYVVEALHDVIHVYDPSGRLLTVIGGSGPGPGQFWLPAGIHIDEKNRILVADSANGRVQILRYLGNPAGGGQG